MIARAYVINLEAETVRREAIARQLEALSIPYEICPAVDGRRFTEEEMSRVYDASRAGQRYRPMTQGEVGCALSHVAVYERFLESGDEWALVLEDDARLGDKVPQVLEWLTPLANEREATVILLTHVDKYIRLGAQRLGEGYSLVRPYQYWWRAHGYLINRAAAQALSTQLRPVWTAADSWKAFADEGWVRLRAVAPYCIGLSELADASSLEGERAVLDEEDKAQARPFRWYVKHYLYSRFLHQLFIRPFLRVVKQRMTW